MRAIASVVNEFEQYWNVKLFRDWYYSPNTHLNFNTPAHLVEVGEAGEVRKAIEASAYGAYA
jgi:hypothetical protein